MSSTSHIDYLEAEIVKANNRILELQAQQSKDHVQLHKHMLELDSKEGYIKKLEKELEEVSTERDKNKRRAGVGESLRGKIKVLERRCEEMEEERERLDALVDRNRYLEESCDELRLCNKELRRKCEEFDRMEAMAGRIYGLAE